MKTFFIYTTQCWSVSLLSASSLSRPSLTLHSTNIHYNLQGIQAGSCNDGFLKSFLSTIFLDKSQDQDFKSKQTVVTSISMPPQNALNFVLPRSALFIRKQIPMSKYLDLICQKISAILFQGIDKNIAVSIFTNIWGAI